MAHLRDKCYNLEQGPRNQYSFGGLEAIPGLFLVFDQRLAVNWWM